MSKKELLVILIIVGVFLLAACDYRYSLYFEYNSRGVHIDRIEWLNIRIQVYTIIHLRIILLISKN